MGPPLAAQTEPKAGHPHFQNFRLKLSAALHCEAAHSVVTGIRHWYQVIRQAAKFFHLLCCFERSAASPFGRASYNNLANGLSATRYGGSTARSMRRDI
jgi:hypothetical protein